MDFKKKNQSDATDVSRLTSTIRRGRTGVRVQGRDGLRLLPAGRRRRASVHLALLRRGRLTLGVLLVLVSEHAVVYDLELAHERPLLFRFIPHVRQLEHGVGFHEPARELGGELRGEHRLELVRAVVEHRAE